MADTYDDRLAKEFPDFAALASPKPIAAADVQALLRDDEALLLFLDGVTLDLMRALDVSAADMERRHTNLE